MNTIEKLTEIFKEFPGIGERQAKRFVYFLMSRNGAYNDNISQLISELKKETAQCKDCFRFFILNPQKDKVCDICSDTHIDSSTLMIIEKDSDFESVRKSRAYSGRYFILGGLVPVVEKNTKSFVRIEELKKKISMSPEIKEIILAFSLNPQGDHTDVYVREQLGGVTINIKISSLGRGLSTGTELEYSDNDTLKNALKNRN